MSNGRGRKLALLLTVALGATVVSGCKRNARDAQVPDAPRTVVADPAGYEGVYVEETYVYQEPPSDVPEAVGYEKLSTGDQVRVVTYVHTYPEPIESFPRVYWAGRWYYNIHGDFIFYSDVYGGWVYYWGPPVPLVTCWNYYYPWAPYYWAVGYYGPGWYWGGVTVYGYHAYGLPVHHHHHHHHHHYIVSREPHRGAQGRPAHRGEPGGRPTNPGKPSKPDGNGGAHKGQAPATLADKSRSPERTTPTPRRVAPDDPRRTPPGERPLTASTDRGTTGGTGPTRTPPRTKVVGPTAKKANVIDPGAARRTASVDTSSAQVRAPVAREPRTIGRTHDSRSGVERAAIPQWGGTRPAAEAPSYAPMHATPPRAEASPGFAAPSRSSSGTPSFSSSPQPSRAPAAAPSRASSPSPAFSPSPSRSSPSRSGSAAPSRASSPSPAFSPSPSRSSPSRSGSAAPSRASSPSPAFSPSPSRSSPSRSGSAAPSRAPSPSRSVSPSRSPSRSGSAAPSRAPSPSRGVSPSRGGARRR